MSIKTRLKKLEEIKGIDKISYPAFTWQTNSQGESNYKEMATEFCKQNYLILKEFEIKRNKQKKICYPSDENGIVKCFSIFTNYGDQFKPKRPSNWNDESI